MIIASVMAVAYAVVFIVAAQRRTRRDPAEGWLLAYCGYSALLMALHAVILSQQVVLPPFLTAQTLVSIGFALSITLAGLLTLAYLAYKRGLVMLAIFDLAWLAGALVATYLHATPLLAGQAWLPARFQEVLTLGIEILSLGWLLQSLALFLLVLRAFLVEPLPLYANRILFWAVVFPLLMLGDALAAWLLSPWNELGYVLRMAGAIGAAYAVTSHRVLDLRGAWRWIVSRSILTLATAALVGGGILAVLYVQIPGLRPVDRWVSIVAVALLVAILNQPIRRLFQWLLRGLIVRDVTDPAEAVRLYSQRISGVIDLRELADIAVKTINELLMTRRGCLILITHEAEQVSLERIGDDKNSSANRAILSLQSPIYKHFKLTRRPLLQYDIDYHKDYLGAASSERHYFASLEMDVYAPIIRDDNLIGLLALGPKANDDPFRSSEMDLLSALANQTVVALENARLVNGLRALNQEITSLNEDLRASNERLERLDKVKTDFIAIASHELRTPLTQIQGYSDLLGEMASRNMLDPQETVDITRSLTKATQRMADVITSMLDVSQIDVDSMDLNFIETPIANVLKLAVEPYASAIHERKLTLVARGLRNLPLIYADYKRLVQAFQNLITNAIKFTPDGGKIDVSGEIFEKDKEGQPTSIRIIVADTGIGVDPAHHELIFEKFFRVGPTALHSTGQTKFKGAGPGLGLSIAKGIIEGHGGRIWVESEGHDEEKMPGSAFHVVLPIRPPAMDARKRMSQLQEEAEAAKHETIISRPGSLGR
jgi:signal transduction histidine kinase